MEFQLPIVELYTNVALNKIRMNQVSLVNELLNKIKGTLSDKDWDTIVFAIINMMVNELRDRKGAEKFIGRLVNNSKKVMACLICHKFQAAYLIAARKSVRDVQLVLDYCKNIDSKTAKTVTAHCNKFLEKYNKS